MKQFICLLLLGLTGFVAASERTVEKNFNVNADATLSIDNHKGRIIINTHAANEINITARIYMGSTDATISESDTARLLDALEITFKASPGSVVVSVDHEKMMPTLDQIFGKNRTLPSVDFDVLVPLDASLKVTSHKAAIEIEAPSGTINILSHKGRGSISGIANTLALISHKGTFTLGFDQVANTSIETHKGHITLNMPAGDYQVNGHTHKGSINIKGRDAIVEHEKRDTTVELTEGAGTYMVSLETHKGNISLNIK